MTDSDMRPGSAGAPADLGQSLRDVAPRLLESLQDDDMLEADLRAKAAALEVLEAQADQARAARDRLVKVAASRGWPLRRIGDLAGVSFRMVARIRDA